MREQQVAVAIVKDQQGRFLVTYNAKWSGYAFPMQNFDPESQVMTRSAIEALESDLKTSLIHAIATEFEYLGALGRSDRTGEDTWYDYWLFEIDPGQPLNPPQRPRGVGQQPLFLDANALLSQTDLTWSTRLLAGEFLEKQDAVLAIMTRPGNRKTEYLVLWNDNYLGYFFPTTRIKTEHKPEQVAKALIRADMGYRGPIDARWLAEVTEFHFSGRVLRNRTFRFQICQVDLPDVDLHRPANPLELVLAARKKRFRWVTDDELADATIGYSSTMSAVRSMIIGVAPPVPRRDPQRRSEGGLALIRRTVNGEIQWLAQWNKVWKGIFFVGGHRKLLESFRECVTREVQEELALRPSEFSVSQKPEAVLEYHAFSTRAQSQTSYHQEFFSVTIVPEALARVEREHDNVWLSESAIRRLEADDARPISVTMLSLLSMSGAITV